MLRIARVVAVGYPHHITQRGNYGQNVFLEDKDKEQYLSWIQEYSDKFDLSLLTGRSLCEEQFIKELENKLGRNLAALPVGRPKKME